MNRMDWIRIAAFALAPVAASADDGSFWAGTLACGEREVQVVYLADGDSRYYASDDGQRRVVRGADASGAWHYDLDMNRFTGGDGGVAAWVQSHDFHALATDPQSLYAPGPGFLVDAAGKPVRMTTDKQGRTRSARLVAGEGPLTIHVHWDGERLDSVSFEPGGGCSRLHFDVMRPVPASPAATGKPRPLALRRWHGLHRLAHLAGLPWLMTGPVRDGFEEVRGDAAQKFSRTDFEARFRGYFSRPAIAQWRDCQAPAFRSDGDAVLKDVVKWVRIEGAEGHVYAWTERWQRDRKRWWQQSVINLDPPPAGGCGEAG